MSFYKGAFPFKEEPDKEKKKTYSYIKYCGDCNFKTDHNMFFLSVTLKA